MLFQIHKLVLLQYTELVQLFRLSEVEPDVRRLGLHHEYDIALQYIAANYRLDFSLSHVCQNDQILYFYQS
ncbi:hypothetical protein D3C80_344680 [compost metagenome]